MDISNISIVIPIKADSANLNELLANLSEFDFDDIHVVDSELTEQNESVCFKFNCKYTVFNWDGRFPKKRNWYLESAKLRDWVFFLDSDERITRAFYNELLDLYELGFDAFYVKYNNTFLGKKLKYGDVMTKTPIFRKHIRFEKVEELGWSTFDMEIHEHPIIEKTRIGRCYHRIEHLEKTTLEKYLAKHNNYSSWESSRLASEANLNDPKLRTRMKYRLLKSPFIGIIYFTYAYFIKLGFLDLLPGYYLARLKAQYFFWIRLKYKYETRIN